MDDDRELDDGDFDYEEVAPASSVSLSRPQIVSNLPHDEEISLSDSENHGNISDGASDGGTPDHGHDNLITRESPDSVGQPDMLRAQSGLDESALESSEPTILRRILRSTMKGTAALEVDEKPHEGIQHDDTKRDAKIDAWIASVEQLREVENAGEFKPKNRFPSLDTLMQSWPEELEPLVKNLRVANTHVPVDLNTLCRGVCNVLDIPVYEDILESLHWVFMLYLELKNCEQSDANMMGGADHINMAKFV